MAQNQAVRDEAALCDVVGELKLTQDAVMTEDDVLVDVASVGQLPAGQDH